MSRLDDFQEPSKNQSDNTTRQDDVLSVLSDDSATLNELSAQLCNSLPSTGEPIPMADTLKDTLTRNATVNKDSLHHDGTVMHGFSLSEALVWLTVLCIAFIFGLQWYMAHQEKQAPHAADDPSYINTTIATPEDTADDVVFLDEPLPAGAPALGEDSIGEGSSVEGSLGKEMVIQFGSGDTAVQLHVPGRVVVTTMPVGMADQEAEISWFFPE